MLLGGIASAQQPIDADHAAKMARGLDLFKKHVRPVLVDRCLKCHGGKSTEADFDLSDRQGLLRGGNSGPAIVAGNARDSLLYKLITHGQKPHMPHKSARLPAEEIAHIAAWIDLGAPFDADLVAGKSKVPAWTQRVIAADARQFWSFQPLTHPQPPSVRNDSWCSTPIDRFVLARMEAAGVAPNLAVSKRQLIRRVYFDTIGLPPSPGEVEAFLNDDSADAYDRLLDRLLESPHFGERWGRRWLDLARFAESHGFEHDYDRPTAYPYRDFVIRALNDDLPYNTFVRWQIAGDEIAPGNRLALAATGYLAAGVHSTQITKNEVEKHRYDEMDDMLATIGTSLLGLTIGCARCHDHKYDPIPQRDYYRLLSTFTTTVRSDVNIDVDPKWYVEAKALFDREHAPYVAAFDSFEEKQLAARLVKGMRSAPSLKRAPRLVLAAAYTVAKGWRALDSEWRRLEREARLHARQAPKPRLVKTMVSTEGLPAVRLHTQGDDFLKETCFLRRGDPEQKEGVAGQGFLQVLTTASDGDKHWQLAPPSGWRTSYRRLALADWLCDVDQGAGRLLARVIVNRLWQHYVGRGIVATPSDFGSRGERPTHPELLDWLATELIRGGWRLKPIHKLIASSAVYRQSSQRDEVKMRVDPDDRLFWRHSQRRLEGEIIRDSLLAVSGELDPRQFGPGTLDEASKRRSIYFTVKRSKLVPMLHVFDAPDALGSLADRPTTTIAPQALLLMNNPHVRGWSRSFARRIAPDAMTRLDDAIQSGYRTALARPPSSAELADGLAFVQSQLESYRSEGKENARELALADFCQVLLCLNEFIYVE